MNEPVIDDRDQAEIFETLLERADTYVDDWDPQSADVGRTLTRIFATFEDDVRKRLNEVPEKHLLAFLDALDFERRRPQAARTPLSFDVSSDLDRNVPIPGGTTAIADPPAGESQQFELPQDGGFEATPARLTDVVGVTPETDRIVDSSAVIDDEETTLFTGENDQSHALYMENETALTLEAGSPFSVRVETDEDASQFVAAVEWEYYGEDEDGEEGWHALERPGEEEFADDESSVEALQERLQQRESRTAAADSETVEERLFRAPGDITSHEVNGVESHWIRCRLPDDASVVPVTVDSISVHVASTDREDGLQPDTMLSNDVPLAPEDGPLRPFGRVPHPPVTFFVSCEEAFTNPGGVVELEFSEADTDETTGEENDDDSEDSDVAEQAAEGGMGVLDGPPQISWEYWNGDAWTRLASVSDETHAMRTPGSVQFEVPDDIAPTTVSGHVNVWIRARLVSGNYGQPAYDMTDEGERGSLVNEPDEPVYGDVTVHYEQSNQAFDTVFSHNNASYSRDLSVGEESFAPFVELPDDAQTVYFGFDDTLENGPLTLFVPVEDTTYPPSFDPGVQWEYCVDPQAFEWEKLDVHDQTGGLTERGIVMLTFPTPTRAVELFGRECHWIRARVTKDPFETRADDGETAPSEPVDVTTDRTRSPPVLEGLYQNTQLAYNKTTVEDEVLGSSDGSHEQSFTCAHAPIIDIEVWVDELSTLSAGECRRLSEQAPESTAAEYDSRGERTAFWVRWEAVDDFLDSTPRDRHYVVNRTLGTVAFGDGDNGRIPPGGQDNVRATYTTGGGNDGNVAARTVTDLKSSIALVDSVTNPRPADGGADIESTETLVERSTNRIKHRNRAVTARDYEQVARAEFPELARVTCDPDHEGGTTRVTVLVIPQTEREKPVPSIELKHQVRETLYEHAPASLVGDEDADIVVRGPGYSELSVEATIHATNVKSVSLLKTRVERRLDQYLHPLTGNHGDGWSFGDLPNAADIGERLADVESVTEVLNFEATFEVGGETHSLGDHESVQSLLKDTLVCSGTHEITVTTEV